MTKSAVGDRVRNGKEGGVLTVSDAARTMVLEARAGEENGEGLALWVEVTGTGGDGFLYDMYFEEPTDAKEGDAVHVVGDLTVVVPQASVEQLTGATLDVSAGADGEGLVMVNPNRPATPGLLTGMALDGSSLDSPIARHIAEVLDTEVNPAIASHGGRASLVAVGPAEAGASLEVEGTPVIAYLVLSGGCQGCGMAKATLSQGIEVALRESVPTVVGVVDVTDHAGGVNPYF